MIDPKELRIGNWVNLEFVGPFQWEYTHFEDYIKDKKHGYSFDEAVVSDKIEPILLTPEILERCGVDKVNDFFSIRIDEYIWLHIYEGGIYGFWSDSVENESNFTLRSQDNRIHYLHQLQNLYLSLTGEELEIKELQHA